MSLRDAVVAAIEDLENAPDCELGNDTVTGVLAALRNSLVEDNDRLAKLSELAGKVPIFPSLDQPLLARIDRLENRLFEMEVARDADEGLWCPPSAAKDAPAAPFREPAPGTLPPAIALYWVPCPMAQAFMMGRATSASGNEGQGHPLFACWVAGRFDVCSRRKDVINQPLEWLCPKPDYSALDAVSPDGFTKVRSSRLRSLEDEVSYLRSKLWDFTGDGK